MVGGYINSGVSGYINAIGASFHQDHTLQAVQQGTTTDIQAQQTTMQAARNAVNLGLQGTAVDPGDYADSAAAGAQNGFTSGAVTGQQTQE